MSETRDGQASGGGRTKAGETIIDAKVEPIRRLNWGRPQLRVLLLLIAAIIVSIVIAVLWQLGSTGRLSLADLTGLLQRGETTPVPAAPPPAAPNEAKPGAIAAKPAAAGPEAAQTTALSQRVADLDRRLAALADGIDRLQQLPASGAATATVSPQQLSDLATGLQGQMQSLLQGRFDAVGKRLDALEKTVAALQQAKDEQAADRIVVQQRMDEFDARLNAAVANRAAALRAPVQQILAWSELRDRARRGLPFPQQLRPLQTLAGSAGGTAASGLRDAIAALQPFADQGAPTLVGLLGAFPVAAEKQAAAFRAPDTDAAARPWWQRAFDKLTGLISVRRIDAAPDAATPQGRLTAAEAALRDGDLAAAAAALDGMTLVPALAEWRRQAEARLHLDAALETSAAALQAYFAAP